MTCAWTNELLAAMLERITEQAFPNSFRNVILMGDHAGGQSDVYEGVANKLNARYGALRVFYCDQVYRPANDAFDLSDERECHSHKHDNDGKSLLF